MVSQRRRRTRKPPLMGSHQRCWLWGRHVVLETLRAGHWPIVELRVDNSLEENDVQFVTDLAAERSIPVVRESSARLTKLCGASDHQGLLAKMRPFPYGSLDEIVASTNPPTALVMLDRIQDPYNFGAIIRAADVLGIDGIIVGQDGQAEVNSQVARSSAGAVNHLAIARVGSLVDAAEQLRRLGFQILAADASAEKSVAEAELTRPTVVVMGNESVGVGDALIDACDATVRIPQVGQIASLNVAVAAGILFYELHRQRRGGLSSGGAV